MNLDTQSSNWWQTIDNFLSFSSIIPVVLDLEEWFSSHSNIFQMLKDGNIWYRFHTSGWKKIHKTDILAWWEEFIGENLYQVDEFDLDDINWVYAVIRKIRDIYLHLYFIVDDWKIKLFLKKRSADDSINLTTKEAREWVSSVIN